jgi:hypothetical protein
VRGISDLLFVLFVFFFCIGAAVRLVGAMYSARIRKLVVARPVLHGIWFLVALLAVVDMLHPHHFGEPPPLSGTRVRRTLVSLETACKRYFTEYALYPAGDNATILKALLGTNPRSIVFLELRSRDTNSVGEVIDPWGTAYRFTQQEGKPPLIQSAGPDRVFDNKDDLSTSSP